MNKFQTQYAGWFIYIYCQRSIWINVSHTRVGSEFCSNMITPLIIQCQMYLVKLDMNHISSSDSWPSIIASSCLRGQLTAGEIWMIMPTMTMDDRVPFLFYKINKYQNWIKYPRTRLLINNLEVLPTKKKKKHKRIETDCTHYLIINREQQDFWS